MRPNNPIRLRIKHVRNEVVLSTHGYVMPSYNQWAVKEIAPGVRRCPMTKCWSTYELRGNAPY
jgi:hypothetical protein